MSLTQTHPHFVPNGDDRRALAVLLVGTADEKGIDQRSIASTHTGYYITEELAEALADEGVEVRRDTNPYSSVNGPLADRRLDLNSDAVGPTGEPASDGSPREVKTVDGPLADTRLDLHSEERGNAVRDLNVIPDADDLDDDDLDDDLDDEDEDSEEDDDSDDEDDEDDEDGSYDPAAMVDQGMTPIKAFVTENPEQAETILAAEREGKDRPKMIEWLDEFIADRDAAPADESL